MTDKSDKLRVDTRRRDAVRRRPATGDDGTTGSRCHTEPETPGQTSRLALELRREEIGSGPAASNRERL